MTAAGIFSRTSNRKVRVFSVSAPIPPESFYVLCAGLDFRSLCGAPLFIGTGADYIPILYVCQDVWTIVHIILTNSRFLSKCWFLLYKKQIKGGWGAVVTFRKSPERALFVSRKAQRDGFKLLFRLYEKVSKRDVFSVTFCGVQKVTKNTPRGGVAPLQNSPLDSRGCGSKFRAVDFWLDYKLIDIKKFLWEIAALCIQLRVFWTGARRMLYCVRICRYL